jgi:diaminohydroxyphosphoribosylaminopyrimidine deaminase/5-amino-6-(5-phosphoribosylamino)uracil reductase
VSVFSAFDHAHMARALQLAERGACTTKPNPMVGCVIARGERVLGEGFHAFAGEPHAEVFALRQAGEAARGATAYVTLEPCAHFGRTPPCAEALVQAGIARVVAAAPDPYHAVNGDGFRRLMAAGIAVEQGLMQAEARELNRGFYSRIERDRPWVRVKLACSLDGRTALAYGESKWISGEAARADVQQWRARSAALLTGSGTVLVDDPLLTARNDPARDLQPPLRVVLDSEGRLPAGCRIFDASAPTLGVHAGARVPDYADRCETAVVPEYEEGGLDLEVVMALLAQRGVNEVQVEAGARLCGALLQRGLVDELLVYQAPVLLGERGRPLFAGMDPITMAERAEFSLREVRRLGDDLRLWLRPREKPQRREL